MGLAIGDGRLIATGKPGSRGGQWHGRADHRRSGIPHHLAHRPMIQGPPRARDGRAALLMIVGQACRYRRRPLFKVLPVGDDVQIATEPPK